MWNDEAYNQISEEERSLYMAGSIHPAKAGNLEWGLLNLERKIESIISKVR